MTKLLNIITASVLLAALPATVGASGTATPWQCSRSDINLYDYSASVAQACGYTVYPLDHVGTRADGGRDYVYIVGGHSLVRPVPPPGFDPGNATDAQLASYGFPPRPADTAEAATWQQDVKRYRSVPPPPFIIETNVRAGVQAGPCSSDIQLCWGGYLASSSTFTTSYIDYYEPYQAQSSCTGDAVATWTGIGGLAGPTIRLAQAGTFPHVGGGIADHQDFQAVLPDEQYAVLMNLVASGGDDLQVSVQWDAPGWTFTVRDTTKGLIDDQYYPTDSYDAGSAEWIIERPQYNNTITPLRNFWAGWTVNAAQANNIGMQNFHLTVYNIHNKAGTPLESTGSHSGQSFGATWLQCG